MKSARLRSGAEDATRCEGVKKFSPPEHHPACTQGASGKVCAPLASAGRTIEDHRIAGQGPNSLRRSMLARASAPGPTKSRVEGSGTGLAELPANKPSSRAAS